MTLATLATRLEDAVGRTGAGAHESGFGIAVGGIRRTGLRRATGQAPLLRAFDEVVEGREHEQGEHRRRDETADHDDRERLRDEAAVSGDAERHRREREDGRQRCHEDGAQASRAARDGGVVRRQSLLAVLIHQVDEHDGVGDDDSDEHQHADQRRDAQRHAGGDLQQDRAGGRERHGHQQQQRLPQRLEGRDHDDVDDQDRREQCETELREGVGLLGDDAAELGVGALRQFEVVQRRGHRGRRRGEVVRRRCDRDGRRALTALGGDRGRALGLLDRRDLLQRDRPGRGRNLQVAQLLEGRGRVGGIEVDGDRGVIDLDRADRLRLHGVGDQGAHGDLRQAALGGRIPIDHHGDVGQRRRQVAGHLADAVEIAGRSDDVVGRLLQRRRIGGGDVDLDVARAEPPTAGSGHDDVAGIREVSDNIGDLFAESHLIGVLVGGDRVGDARAAAGERVVQRRTGRADRYLHGVDAVDVGEGVLDLLGGGRLGLEARSRTDRLADRERVLARVPEEVRLHERGGRDRSSQHERREGQRHPRVAQRPAQDRQIALLQAGRWSRRIFGIDRPALLVEHRLAGLEEPVRQHRHDRERDQERGQHGDRDRQREGAEQLPGDVADERDRQEHRDRGDRRRRDRRRDLADGQQDRRFLVGVADVMPLDVLDDDDRVVHDAPDRDGEGTEGEDVQRVAEGLDADEGDEHACRDRDRRDEGRAHRQQEDQDDEHREDEAQHPLHGEGLDGLLDVRRLIEHDGELRPAEVVLESAEEGRHPLRHLNRVRGGELGDGDREGGFAVDPGDARLRVLGELHLGDIADGDQPRLRLFRVAGHEGQLPDFVDAGDLHAGLDREGLPVLGDLATREEHTVLIEGIGDRLLRVARRSQFGVIRSDGDALTDRTDDLGGIDPVHVFDVGDDAGLELRLDGLGVVIAGDGELDDREVVDARGDDVGLDPVGQLRRDAVDRLRHLLLGRGEIGVVVEGCLHDRRVRGAGRRARLQPGDALYRRLDRRGDVGVDHLGRGTRVGGDDDEGGELDRGDQFLLEAVERDAAEDGGDDGDQGDQRAVLEAQDGEIRHV